MEFIATIDPSGIIALAMGVFGLGGVIFTALKYNRDDTTAIVSQQDVILRDMKSLNEELRTTAADLRAENELLKTQIQNLNIRVTELTRNMQS